MVGVFIFVGFYHYLEKTCHMPKGLYNSIIIKYSACTWRFMSTLRNRFEYQLNTNHQSRYSDICFSKL